MGSNYCIIPECYIDSCLVEVLLQANRNHVNHQKGNGTVAREMKKSFDGNFCVGIIDEDRKQLKYLDEFELIKSSCDLKLWKHRNKNHYMIQVCPVIEEWIIKTCREVSIKLVKYGIPESLLELKKETKSVTSKTDRRFIQLFKALTQSESKGVVQLKEWLKYLKENKYNADVNQLKNG